MSTSGESEDLAQQGLDLVFSQIEIHRAHLVTAIAELESRASRDLQGSVEVLEWARLVQQFIEGNVDSKTVNRSSRSVQSSLQDPSGLSPSVLNVAVTARTVELLVQSKLGLDELCDMVGLDLRIDHDRERLFSGEEMDQRVYLVLTELYVDCKEIYYIPEIADWFRKFASVVEDFLVDYHTPDADTHLEHVPLVWADYNSFVSLGLTSMLYVFNDLILGEVLPINQNMHFWLTCLETDEDQTMDLLNKFEKYSNSGFPYFIIRELEIFCDSISAGISDPETIGKFRRIEDLSRTRDELDETIEDFIEISEDTQGERQPFFDEPDDIEDQDQKATNRVSDYAEGVMTKPPLYVALWQASQPMLALIDRDLYSRVREFIIDGPKAFAASAPNLRSVEPELNPMIGIDTLRFVRLGNELATPSDLAL